MNRQTVTLIATALSLLLIGLIGGYWWAQRSAAGETKTAAASEMAAKSERKVLYWYDPMVPDQHFDKPGKSPFMDMQLVPKYADEVAAGGVRIDPALQQSVGIRTAVVEVGTLATQLRVPATLTWDLREESVVSARVDAIVTRLNVKAPYEPVHRGQPLATLLAPEWGSAIAEAQALGQARSASARELQGAAQQRLRVLGLSGTGMSRDGSVVLHSPSNGVVSDVLVREGQTVMAGAPLFRVNGTDTLWLEAAIPQAGTGGIEPGTPVTATVDAVRGQTFAGEVETLLPQIDPASRTQRARIVLRNEGGRLATGMFAELTLHSDDGARVPLVPSESLITTGTDSRVIVVGADGSFQPVRVRSGRSSGGRTEILAGLKGGERVVTSGQFLIDSEASLSGALQRLGDVGNPLQPPDPPPSSRRTPGPSDSRSSAAETKALGPGLRRDDEQQQEQKQKPKQKPAPGKRKVLYWYDPMMPDKHFDQPGKSPFMDMQLVPKYVDEMSVDKNAMDDMEMDDRAPAKEPQR